MSIQCREYGPLCQYGFLPVHLLSHEKSSRNSSANSCHGKRARDIFLSEEGREGKPAKMPGGGIKKHPLPLILLIFKNYLLKMLISATEVQVFPFISDKAFKRTYRPVRGANVTSFSSVFLLKFPADAGVPQLTPSALT